VQIFHCIVLYCTSGSLLLCYWTLGYGKTATSRYEHIVVFTLR